MIISSQQVKSILQLQALSPKKTAYQSSYSTMRNDSLELSTHAKELRLAREQVLKSPEIRADKIGELKKQIQEGTYQVSATDIAVKMISRSLVDELAGR